MGLFTEEFQEILITRLKKWSGFVSADSETRNKMIKAILLRAKQNRLINLDSPLVYWRGEDFCYEMQFSTNDF